MGIIRCEKGHFYDDEKYEKCPHCELKEKSGDAAMEDEKTIAKIAGDRKRSSLISMVMGDNERTVSLFSHREKVSSAGEDDERTVSLDSQKGAFSRGNVEDEKTVGIFSKKGTFLPVVGWFVCIEGPEKGRDYRIASGRNFIGRAYSMDITISDDPEISKDRHCSVIYDPKSFKFTLAPGASIAYVNGKELRDPVELEIYDKISLGKTVLQFIPFCKEGVSW